MLNYADYHVHTKLCKHAVGEVEEYLRHAEEIGLAEIGFADHCPWPEGYDEESRMFVDQYDEYRRQILELKASSKQVTVRYGVELDYVPGKMDEVERHLKDETFDYRLGSIHYVDVFPFDNPIAMSEWRKPEKCEWVWTNYPQLMCDFVKTFDFDIIAHADITKKFAIYPSKATREFFINKMTEAFHIAGEKGMALEINTGGLRKTVKKMYPSLELLKIAKQAGLALTLGSDAHDPTDVGANFADARELALEAGFEQFATFENRKNTLHPL